MKRMSPWIGVLILFGITTGSQAYEDQWKRTEETMKQLVDNGYEVRGLSELGEPKFLSKEVILQKGNSVYMCEENYRSLGGATVTHICSELTDIYEHKQ